MELQHQIYLLVAIFGGICTLLLVLIIILGIFVRNVRQSIKEVHEQPQRSINYGFEHETPRHIVNDDLRSMKSEVARRPPHKSNLSKPRNDDSSRHQSNVRPTKDTKRSQKEPDRNDPPRKQRQYSESGDTSGRYSDSAFDNEINNMFDIDDYDDDDDRDSVVSAERNYNNRSGHRNHGQVRSNLGVPPPPPSQGNNRNRNNNNPPPGMNRGGPPGGGGGGGPRSMYPAGNPHEAKTYFNERGMNY
uniref:Putative conserved protein with signal anchor n=1 Tax=Culex tarsalis TaxID=7177 RepID=A0A1Q3FZJ8_CULTA